MFRRKMLVALIAVAALMLGVTVAGAATQGDDRGKRKAVESATAAAREAASEHDGDDGSGDGEWREGPRAPRTVAVQVLAFNDFHGNLQPPTGSSGRILTPTGNVDAGGVEYLGAPLLFGHARRRPDAHERMVVMSNL